MPTTVCYDGTDRPDRIEWVTFQFKPEFNDLRANGYVSGTVDEEPDGHGTRTVIFQPQITISGSVKLAELSEYLWKTSYLGMIMSSLIKFFWLVTGIVIGYLASLVFSTAS